LSTSYLKSSEQKHKRKKNKFIPGCLLLEEI
jgi:hypothetical protein